MKINLTLNRVIFDTLICQRQAVVSQSVQLPFATMKSFSRQSPNHHSYVFEFLLQVIYSHVWFELICSRAGSSFLSAGISLPKRQSEQTNGQSVRQVNRLTKPMNSCNSHWGRIVHSQRRLRMITLYAVVWALNQRTHNGNQPGLMSTPVCTSGLMRRWLMCHAAQLTGIRTIFGDIKNQNKYKIKNKNTNYQW